MKFKIRAIVTKTKNALLSCHNIMFCEFERRPNFLTRIGIMFISIVRYMWSIVLRVTFFLTGITFMTWLGLCTFFNGNVLPIISTLVIRPISLSAHESLLCCIASLGWSVVVYYCVLVGRFNPLFYGDIDLLATKYTGNKLLLANHISMTDGVTIFAVAHRVQRLGQLRFFAKKSLLFFPVLGLGCYFLNFVFLSRNWLKDGKKIRDTFSDMMKWKRFWMCLFPEGTRISINKLRESQAFARERNIRPLHHVLQPRVKGLCAVLAALRSEVLHCVLAAALRAVADAAVQVDSVVDVTIGYEGRDLATGRADPSLSTLLLSRPAAAQAVHVHVRVLPAAELPDGGDAAAVSAWIGSIFEEKVAAPALAPPALVAPPTLVAPPQATLVAPPTLLPPRPCSRAAARLGGQGLRRPSLAMLGSQAVPSLPLVIDSLIDSFIDRLVSPPPGPALYLF